MIYNSHEMDKLHVHDAFVGIPSKRALGIMKINEDITISGKFLRPSRYLVRTQKLYIAVKKAYIFGNFNMPETHYFEQQDGSRIAYKILEPHKSEDMENEVPLVLLMGLWSTKEYFMGLEEELAKNRKVILLDNRGMGESSVLSTDDPITLDLMAQDTIALVRNLGIKRFNLLGWSMGGMTALSIAINMPSDLKLEKLILVASSARSLNAQESLNVQDSLFERLYNLPGLKFPQSVQEQKDEIMKRFEKNFTDYLLEHPDKLDKFAEIRFNANRPFEIFKRQWEAMKQFNPASKLQTIKVPTLIIHGEEDATIAIKESELLAKEIPNNKFIRIPKVGHMFWPIEPKSAVFINDFLLE